MKAQTIGGTADHPITIDAAKGRAKVSWKGAVIADWQARSISRRRPIRR